MYISKDIKYSLRTLFAKPAYFAIVTFTLAIGLGLTATMFSLVNSILLKPLPLPESQQLVQLGFETPSRKNYGVSFNVFKQLQMQESPLQAMAFVAYDQAVLSQGTLHTPLTMQITSAGYLSLMDVPAHRGRWYNQEDLGNNVVVLNYDAWYSYFDADESIIGKTILLNKLAYTVVGVMPAGLLDIGPSAPQLWSPISELRRPGAIYGRLQADIEPQQATRQSGSLNRLLNKLSDPKSGVWSVTYTSLKEQSIREIKPPLLLLSLAVSAVFLIAIINVVNLTFVHYMDRTHELSVRVAVGASRQRLIGQLLTESFILAAFGGLLGLLLTAWGLEAIKLLAVNRIPRLNEVGLDVGTLAISFTLILVAAVTTALLPAYRLLKPEQLALALKESGGKSAGSKSGHAIRQTLVATEVTLAVVLLIGAGLLLRSYGKLMDVDPGFTMEQRVTGHVWLPDSYAKKQVQYNHFRTVLQEIALLPEVAQVAGTSTLPMSQTGIDYDVTYSFDEAQSNGSEDVMLGATRAVTSNYFSVLQIPLVSGRFFDVRDNTDSAPVVIINQALAKTLWQDVSPIGRTLILPDWLGGSRAIIGVVGDVRHNGLRGENKPEFFTPFSQQIYPGMSLIAEVRGGIESNILKKMADTATRLEVAAPLIAPSKLSDLASASIEEERVLLQIISVFSGLSLLMASIGVYGISSNMVSQRTKEIGIRMAMGASPKGIRHWVVMHALKPVAIGATLGIALAVVLVQVISSSLYRVAALDPIVYALVPIILVAVALLATWWPALRATSVNPQHALKHE